MFTPLLLFYIILQVTFTQTLKILLVRPAYERQLCKFGYQIEKVTRISLEVHAWLRAIPMKKWALLHDELTTSNLPEVFNNVQRAL